MDRASGVAMMQASQYKAEVLLKDGSRITLRPMRRDDAELWVDFVSRLSPHSKYLHFHHAPESMGMEDALRFCTVDYANAFAVVAEVLRDKDRHILGIGRYYRLPGKDSAEIALAIRDDYQGKGLGTRLIEALANVARKDRIAIFHADVLAENEEMMAVLRNYGFHITSELESGVYHVTFPIARSRTVLRKEGDRERTAAVASLRSILSPRSIAVVGASREPGSIGQLILQCIMDGRFSGVVYPVNPNAGAVLSVKCYPSVPDIPDDVELAVVAVPASIVCPVVDQCGRKGVRGIIVISDGFKERGAEGATRETELRQIALGYGMRLVGPNCMGVINTDPAVSLNATFSPVYPPPGNVAFLSQSGALGLAILDFARDLNLGISTFVSVGNRADVSSDDLLQYWEQDPATSVILLYMESFGDARSFARIARRVSAAKPIVIVKSGRTAAGSRAARSHPGALTTSEAMTGALFSQAGMIRVNSLEELFDVATMLSNQPVPRGTKVAIVTNGGGPGILAADACEDRGLTLPELSPESVRELAAIVKRDIVIHNPLDMTAGATADEYRGALRVLAGDKGIDAVITIFIPPVVQETKSVEKAISQAAPAFHRNHKPLLACFMGERGFQRKLGASGRFVPCYPFPENAVLALASAARYGEWLSKPQGAIPRLRGISRARARSLIGAVLTRSATRPVWLSATETNELLACYGIRTVDTLLARTAAEAADRARQAGFPVAVKLASATIAHKTEVGGVVLDVRTEEAVARAFTDIRARLAEMGRQDEMQGVIVQNMVTEGVEVIAGMAQDPSFGPVIMFGSGGIYAELLKDVSVKLHPLTRLDARELVRSIKMARLLEGFRGSPASDIPALEELLLRLSALVEDVPQISELDLNPVKAMPRGQGYRVVDARILVT
ncbi:MAG: GNAT family N-acetyltransferase [Chloroflexota bacterium]